MSQPPFQRFLDAYHEDVWRFLVASVGRDAADDCFQETFLSAMRAYPRMRPDNPRAWVLTIAHRKALDQLRAAGRRAVPAGELPDVATEDPPGPDEELRAALAALSSAQREAVVLHHLGGLPHHEIAAALGISPAAARRRAADGIAALRTRLTGGPTA